MQWSRPQTFDERALSDAPEGVGVYAFHQKGIVIYYAAACGPGGIRAKLESHWKAERNPCLILAREREMKVNWCLTEDCAGLLTELMMRFQQQRHRLPRCNQIELAAGMLRQ